MLQRGALEDSVLILVSLCWRFHRNWIRFNWFGGGPSVGNRAVMFGIGAMYIMPTHIMAANVDSMFPINSGHDIIQLARTKKIQHTP